MWVRSKDKETFVEADIFKIENEVQIVTLKDGERIILGEYTSNAEARKELDAIVSRVELYNSAKPTFIYEVK